MGAHTMPAYAQLALTLALYAYIESASAEILTPPYFNLALGKKITATATCGDEGPELYCKLVGGNSDNDEQVIGGQVCDMCDTNSETKRHPPEYAVDGMETWWQSPPLSRGMKYNEVSLTIDLGQEFHVAYVFVRMGNSPRPGLWVLEKSTDYGATFKPWQYFSDSPQDCERFFGKESLQAITRDDSVICSTEYSNIVPVEGGEIPISILNNRPSANKYFNSSVLQEWTRATNVRLRLLRTKNMLGHLMSVARQDPTVTRRYFYSIKDISIGGRCMCNGHADNCDPADPKEESNILVCRCQHNTCGPQCAQCCPGFEQKKWRISQAWDRFSCEPCNCHNHTTECEFSTEIDEQRLSLDIHGNYEGGGVCKNCQHNTEGINCNKCKPTFYRPYGKRWDEIDVCAPCECDLRKETGNCAEETGQCECRPEFQPPYCDSCAYGYHDYPNCTACPCNLNGTEGPICTPDGDLCPCKYNYAGQFCEICADGYYSPECKNCECNNVGSVSSVCDKISGNCTCKSKYSGRTCNQCDAGYYNYPTCSHCNCDTSGTLPNICDDVTGQCICKEGFGGSRCEQCLPGFYMEVRGRERVCVPCNCSAKGSTSTSCSADGKCNCLSNFGGKQCDQCSPGNYKYPECLACECDLSGSIGSTCDDNGQCHCKSNFDGGKCDRCKEQFYNYPACEECNCDPKGVIASFAGCGSVPAGELCQCKSRVQGRICNDCKPLFWNLQDYNPSGCEECQCHLPGTIGGLGTCDTRTGQCACKLHVGERQCTLCQDGFYQLDKNNIFGCTECDCDIGGSIDNNCDKITGQCRCNSRVDGRRCDRPIDAHYFPTLHQFQYELEEGLTPSGPVRFRNDLNVFPDYSWKGYVIFSLLQNEVINVIHISRSSFYLMVIKYVNPLLDNVIASVTVTPESVLDSQQTYNVLLRPTLTPQLVTVAGEKANAPAPFVMNPGNWTLTIKTNKEVMIDYFVLIPEAYYEATVLAKVVDKPCVIGDDKLCKHFAYPTMHQYNSAHANDLVSGPETFIDNPEQLKELQQETNIPLLDDQQEELQFNLNIETKGPYVLVLEYVTPVNNSDTTALNEITKEEFDINTKGTVTVRFKSGEGHEIGSILSLNDCPYTSACRQVVVDDLSKVLVVNVQDSANVVYLEPEHNTQVGILSVVAIPEADWHLDFVTPKPYCQRKDSRCVPATFSSAVDSKKVEVETGIGGNRDTKPPILDNSTMVVFLDKESEPLVIETKVPAPGKYMIVVHYYQPDYPENNINVVLATDGEKFDTKLKLEHCPSISGCRGLLRQADDTNRFMINENVTLTFEGETKGVWLDYILLVISADNKDAILKEANLYHYTQEFISKCAMNHYKVETNETGFCRNAVFSITSEYNSGTLSCLCDVEGSLDFECETFGGQCKCKPNVIGRTCSSCRNGYYGFPNCRPCACPATAFCDDDGNCLCPKNVVGDNCDRCKNNTFNFDVQYGCDDCNCNPLGVENNRLQCDEYTGKCDCKINVIGRTCDHCEPGHHAFPECYECHCNLAGTTDEVCDQNTAQCYCKKHVQGQACDTCKDEYFNLQSNNPDGCTKCYCFGKTTRCKSAELFWGQISGMQDWYLANVEVNRTINIFPYTQPPTILDDTSISTESGEAGEKVVYFGAPNHFLGKRITSYGGYLKYTIFYESGEGGNAVSAADVIIGGANSYIVHTSIELPPSQMNWEHSVRLSEDEFTHLDDSPVSREQIMNVLLNITAVYIRATYWNEATTSLKNVSLDIGVEDWNQGSEQTLSVEECQCPSAYRGHSCEQCAEGHYRLTSGPHAGFCVPCNCNGHTHTCDVNTGICLACDHNTMGDHCEQCIPGYHGDATVGTPKDCLICACPIPIASNNFAFGCELSNNGSLISCDCKPGYGGARCEYCAAGYYGEPENSGDYCKPCNCSGNINVEDPGSCDSITGDCLKCVNNTAGDACNLCAPGFFGDAIFSKNCTACSCNDYGMDYCDSTTGTCVCRSGVIGEMCDQCAPNHWGLNSGQGCTPCNCGIASESPQCDLTTGQCKCAKGVSGKHCDQCAAGFWNYSKDGCDHCNCNTGYAVGFTCSGTGQCQCLPGVIGEKCDRCPDRWVLIPHKGCLECDSCTDALLITVEDMSDQLLNETQDFKDKADSFFTRQRLNYIMTQTQQLKPRVSELRNIDMDAADVKDVEDLEGNTKKLLRSAEFAATDSEKLIKKASDLKENANQVLSSVRENSEKAKKEVAHVADLAVGLELSQQPKVDSALVEARQIQSDIAEKDLTPIKDSAYKASIDASQLLERMNIFVQPVFDQAKTFDKTVNDTNELKKKLEEMLEYTYAAQNTANAADKLNTKNRASEFGSKVKDVTSLNNAATENLIEAAYAIANATYVQAKSKNAIANFSKALDELKTTEDSVENRINDLHTVLPEFNNLADQAKNHVNSLSTRALDLRRLADQENNNTRTKDAYSAASAYSSIVDEIADARESAKTAEEAINNATILNEGLVQRVTPCLERSKELRNEAELSLEEVKSDLTPNITQAETALQHAINTLNAADDENSAIKLSLPTLGAYSLASEIEKANSGTNTLGFITETMQMLGDDLTKSKEFAQSLPKTADETLKMTSNVRTLIDNVDEMRPKISSTFSSVQEKQEELDRKRDESDEKIQKLRELIEQARTIANRLPFGVTFDSTSTLQPRLPDTVDEMSTSTHVSAYFRTKEKNGLLLYLGNPQGTMLRRTKSDDFMVLEIQNGYPHLIMDIGDSAESGRDPARIDSDVYVADNKWYQVIVDRVGRNVKLSIRESLANGTESTRSKDQVLPGQHRIFNLDRQKSKLYVGGAPSDALPKLQGISYPAFEGQIEELMIGNTPVGLWDFVDAANLNGARPRKTLTTSQLDPQEYRFNGRGHVTVDGKYAQYTENHVSLFFKTYAPDGLIYVVGNDTHFFSVEMQEGRVYLQVSLGNPEDLTIIGTTKSYNDGKWHKLETTRFGKACFLSMDNGEPIQMNSSSDDVQIIATESMNFGGNNKGIKKVKNKGFDGCMKQITMGRFNIDLNENTESVGVANGCQFASLVALSGDNSFLKYSDITTENLHLILKFKTSEPDGLLFVYFSRTQTAATQDIISLSLIKGKLVLISQGEELDTQQSTYNDSQWHVVIVTHNENALRLVVDDFDYFSTDTAPAPLHILQGVLFVGGIQPNYVLNGKVGTKTPFVGCIADVTIQERPLNLLEPFNNNSVTFGRCGTTTTTGGLPPEQVPWPAAANTDVLLPVTLPPLAPRQPEPTTVTVSTTITPLARTTPITPRASKPRPPPPPASKSCALVYDPYYVIGDQEEGYRFGTRNDSRIEYSKLPGGQHDGFTLTISFRTFDEHGGLLFYAAAEKSPSQFLAVYMKEGKLNLAFNCGGETAEVQSTQTYNDTEWHSITLARNRGNGKLSVNNDLIGEKSVNCQAPAALAPPFYYGGLKSFTDDIKNNLKGFYQPFKGCLRGLTMNSLPVTDVLERVNSLQCRDNIENGYYFGPSSPANSNYLKVAKSFFVGNEISIKLEVKPRNTTGLLLHVHGKRDFLVLELLENEVVINVENGKGPFHASYKLRSNALCDGKWHEIQAHKSHNVVMVGVDGHFTDAVSGSPRSGSTDTKSALFIGGHERPWHKLRGVRSRRGFTGCIRNLTIGEKPLQVPLDAAHGNVHIGVCPAD